MLLRTPVRHVVLLAALFLTQPGAAHASTHRDARHAYRGPSGQPPADPLGDSGADRALAPPALGVPPVCGPRSGAPLPTRELEPCAFVETSCPHQRDDADWTAWWRANADPFLQMKERIHAEFDVPIVRGSCGFPLSR